MELISNVRFRAHRKSGITTVVSLARMVLCFAVLSPPRDQALAAHLVSAARTLFHQRRTDASQAGDRRRPLEVFEVSRPAAGVSKGDGERCGQVLLRHVFGNTVQEPPVARRYSPTCRSSSWGRVVLRWTARCTGRQFDRIAAVWLGGVEILRTCTAEPVKPPGIEWTVEKDVTRFASLWQRPQPLAVELANVVDGVYTGVYDVTLSVHFYETSSPGRDRRVADVILPFPASSDVHWFRIRDEGDVQTRKMKIPRNAYKAVIEVSVSFHDRDEFWYVNPPSEYNKANNFTGTATGAFREILVTIDELLAGVVYPFPVIYTGGVNPNFWRPVSGIGSFVLPSYEVDITPFLGRLRGDELHEFKVSVTNALPSWLLGLSLHVWVDGEATTTRGEMVSHFGSSSISKTNSEMLFLDGTFRIATSRLVSYSGWLASSFGNLTTSVEYSLRFSHALVYSDGGNGIKVHQESVSEKKVVVKSDERALTYEHGLWRFPLRLSMHQKRCGEEDYVIKASVDHAWEEDQSGYGGLSFFSSLKNRQQSRGMLLVPRDGEIQGVATTKQSLVSDGSAGCYSRSLGVTSNGSFLFDHSHTRCT
jgi:hypothetical protein